MLSRMITKPVQRKAPHTDTPWWKKNLTAITKTGLFFLFILICIGAVICVQLAMLVDEVKNGNLNDAVVEGTRTMKSARALTDSLPIKEVVKHWGNTNNIIKTSKIPWDEVPEWRKLVQKSFLITTNMLKEHPEWSQQMVSSSKNLKEAMVPLASESNQWRKSFRGAADAAVQTLLSYSNDPKTPK